MIIPRGADCFCLGTYEFNRCCIAVMSIPPNPLGYPVLLLAISVAACTVAPAPIKDRPQIVATPQDGQLAITSSPRKTIGEVQPVYVSIANGTTTPRTVVPD